MSKAKLQEIWARRSAFNGWIGIPSAFSAELMSTAGFDCLTIDLQHGLIDYSAMLSMLQALAGTKIIPVVRLGEFTSAQVGQALDAGASTLICPLINTRVQAEAFVRAAKYPPAGHRSFGPARAALGKGAAYFDGANDDVLLLAMIETAQALANIDEILLVDGLDGAYIGPSDLGISLGIGLPVTPPDPRLLQAIDQVLQACRRHDVIAAVHNVPGVAPSAAAAQGFKFITVGSDMEFIMRGAAAAVRTTHGG